MGNSPKTFICFFWTTQWEVVAGEGISFPTDRKSCVSKDITRQL